MAKVSYCYETHLHTREASACSDCWARDYIELYQKIGYTGIIVTDHFYHGNTSVARDLPWKEWVDRFCLGYEHAKAEGDARGFQVFFGWEENFDGDEYLIYGLGKKWLYQHPEMLLWSQQEQLDEVTAAGGLVVQAHPFRERDYLSRVNLHPNQAVAMEAANSGNKGYMDTIAYEYCKKKCIPMTAGSDMHHACNVVKDRCFGMQFTKKLESIQDYVRIMKEFAKNGSNSLIQNEQSLIVEEKRFSCEGRTLLPVKEFE